MADAIKHWKAFFKSNLRSILYLHAQNVNSFPKHSLSGYFSPDLGYKTSQLSWVNVKKMRIMLQIEQIHRPQIISSFARERVEAENDKLMFDSLNWCVSWFFSCTELP
jgi:hypothetical protein